MRAQNTSPKSVLLASFSISCVHTKRARLRDHALDRYGNLTEEQDVYLPQASHTNVAWNRGPNEQFLKLFEWM
jgi:hypothetical protein